MNFTEREIYRNFRPADKRHPGDWAGEHLDVGGWSPWPGKFRYDHMPWLSRPFVDFQRKTCHRLTIVAASGGGKSTVGLVSLAWIIANAPGAALWFEPTEVKAAEYAEMYIMPTLEACPPVRRLFPADRHKKRDESIIFPHMPFFAFAANETNAQSKHVRYIFCDETWEYAPGILAQIHKRTMKFRHNRKVVEMSTGSEAGDETDQAFRIGTAREWQFKCPKCGLVHAPKWRPGPIDTPGGVKWEAKTGATWDYERVKATVYYECPGCLARFAPTEANGWALNAGGSYSGGPDGDHESYHWNAIASDFPLLPTMAVEFLEAKAAVKRGNTQLLREFIHKRLAEAWDIGAVSAVELVASGTGFKMGDPWPAEKVRFMKVDVQQREFWCVIRAWAPGPESRLVWAGNLLTWADVRKCQTDHGVADPRVFIDASHYTNQVYQQCCLWDWNAVKGEDAPMGFLRNGVYEPITEANGRGTPDAILPGSRVRSCNLLRMSEALTSDSLHLFRTGAAKGWAIADDAPKAYRDQMAARVRRTRTQSRTGQKVTEWVTIGGAGEHCWDCERMGVGAAYLAGMLDAPRLTETNQESKKINEH